MRYGNFFYLLRNFIPRYFFCDAEVSITDYDGWFAKNNTWPLIVLGGEILILIDKLTSAWSKIICMFPINTFRIIGAEFDNDNIWIEF